MKMLICTIYYIEIKQYVTSVCLFICALYVISITQRCIHQLTHSLYETKTIAYSASNSILVSYYYYLMQESKSMHTVDIVTIIGI